MLGMTLKDDLFHYCMKILFMYFFLHKSIYCQKKKPKLAASTFSFSWVLKLLLTVCVRGNVYVCCVLAK